MERSKVEQLQPGLLDNDDAVSQRTDLVVVHSPRSSWDDENAPNGVRCSDVTNRPIHIDRMHGEGGSDGRGRLGELGEWAPLARTFLISPRNLATPGGGNGD